MCASAAQGAVLTAILVDLLAGEPPVSIHPTAWMGRWLDAMKRRHLHSSASDSVLREKTGGRHFSNQHLKDFIAGLLVLVSVLVLSALLACLFCILLIRFSLQARVALPVWPARMSRSILEGIALKPTLALRSLIRAAEEVAGALERGDLHTARRLLAWHLVSRDTTALTEHQVAEATISSLAENLCDSVVAPLSAYLVGGLPAAYVYRAANTADAMLGYRTPELEWYGKPSARLDDLLNYIPARISAVLIAISSPVIMGSSLNAIRCGLRDSSLTSSPNGGWPMSAMGGALGVKLEKMDHYVLNRCGRDAGYHDIRKACRLVLIASLTAAVIAESLIGISSLMGKGNA